MILAFLTRFPWALFLTRAVVMILAFTVHELGHALAATALGDSTPREEGRLTLNPRPHIESIGALCMLFLGIGWSHPTHFRPHRMTMFGRRVPDALGGAITVLAGPLANGLIVIGALAWMRALGVGPITPWNTLPDLAGWLTVLVRINMSLALINVLPLFPLDGYQLIAALLPLRALANWHRLAGKTTFVFGLGLGLIALMPIAWFLGLAIPVVQTVNRLLGW